MKREADINAPNNNGETPLHKAVINQKTDMIKLLLEKGADIKAKDNTHRTPLHRAIIKENTQIIELLLNDDKADINAPGNNGETPLHIAVAKANTKIIKLLLEKGASTTIKNEEKETVLDVVKKGKKKEVKQIIEDHNVATLFKEINKKNPDKVKVKALLQTYPELHYAENPNEDDDDEDDEEDYI